MIRFTTILLAGWAAVAAAAQPSRPNVVFILTDNHGAWTLGCYGNKEIRTPRIDRLAAEGMLFTRAYCANSVCSPSRATFLTGLMPSQHGVHSYIPASAQIGPKAFNTIGEFSSLPGILSREGYACGLAGKWHLGDNLRAPEGFTYWFTKAGGHTTTFINDNAVWEGKVYKEPGYMTDVITDHAIRFLEQNRERPFFLYLAYNGPYGLGAKLLRGHTNRHTTYYADKPMESFPRGPASPWLRSNRDCIDDVDCMRGYAAAVSGVDDGVGKVMDALSRLGLDESTVVVFSADQGLNAGHGGYWGMGDHSRPINTREPTVRIPLIWRHPGGIPAGQRSDLMTSNYDFLPTLLGYLGIETEAAASPSLPGRDYSGALIGGSVDWDNVIFHEYENARMINNGDWKLTLRHPFGPDELYNLREDPGESENLIHIPQHGAVRKQLSGQLADFFAQHADPRYDLWRGGQSKAGRLLRLESGER